MMNKKMTSALGVIALAAMASTALAELPADQVARLGKDLTPVGGEMAGNAAGTIPAWDGGIKSAADAGFPDFKSGGHHPDPFADDRGALYRQCVEYGSVRRHPLGG